MGQQQQNKLAIMFHYYDDTDFFGYPSSLRRQYRQDYALNQQRQRQLEYERRRAAAIQAETRRRQEQYEIEMHLAQIAEEERFRRRLREKYARQRNGLGVQNHDEESKEALIYGRDGNLYRVEYYPELEEKSTDEKDEEMNNADEGTAVNVPVRTYSKKSNQVNAMENITDDQRNPPIAINKSTMDTTSTTIPVTSDKDEKDDRDSDSLVEYASDDEQDQVCSLNSRTPCEELGESWLEPVNAFIDT